MTAALARARLSLSLLLAAGAGSLRAVPSGWLLSEALQEAGVLVLLTIGVIAAALPDRAAESVAVPGGG